MALTAGRERPGPSSCPAQPGREECRPQECGTWWPAGHRRAEGGRGGGWKRRGEEGKDGGLCFSPKNGKFRPQSPGAVTPASVGPPQSRNTAETAAHVGHPTQKSRTQLPEGDRTLSGLPHSHLLTQRPLRAAIHKVQLTVHSTVAFCSGWEGS